MCTYVNITRTQFLVKRFFNKDNMLRIKRLILHVEFMMILLVCKRKTDK